MAQLAIIAFDAGFVLAAFVVAACCGWWAVAPLRDSLAFPLAVAALAGLVLLPLGTLTLSVPLSWPLQRAAPVTCLALCALSAAAWLADRRAMQYAALGWGALAVVIAAAIAVPSLLPDEIRAGEPALAMIHGSDHVGYAHVGDWLRTRLQGPRVILDQTQAYPSFVDVMFRGDPRFGSFALAALVGMASGRSGAFSYGLACAVVTTIGAVGVAGAFARGRAGLVLLAAALAASPLYDQAQTGYFGKLCGGFALALAARLVLAWCEGAGRTGLWGLAAVACVGAGAAIMYNGTMTAVLVAAIGAAFIALSALDMPGEPWRRRLGDQRDAAIAVALVAGVAFLSSGIVARPAFVTGPQWDIPWMDLLARATGVESEIGGVALLPGVRGATIAVLGAAALALMVAVGRRAAVGGAFILGPLLVAAIMAVLGRWHFYQLAPILPVLAIVGIVALSGQLWSERAAWPWRALAAAALAIAVALQVPRFAGAVRLYGFTALPELRFVRGEIDRLAAAIGTCGAYVDMRWHIHVKMFIMVELGWRGVPLQWSPDAWNMLLWYRRWPPPTYEQVAALRIMRRGDTAPAGSELVVQTRQLDLVRVPGAGAACAAS